MEKYPDVVPKKNLEIDVLRALAIVLVVFGHSIILYSSQWGLFEPPVQVPTLDLIKRWINLLQMPLFISISGFWFYSSYRKRSYFELFIQKGKRILIPYVFFYFVWLFPIRSILKFGSYKHISINLVFHDFVLGQDNGHLWFLPFLFICFFIGKLALTVVNNYLNHRILLLALGGCFFVGLNLISGHLTFLTTVKPLYDVCDQFVWFYLGFILREFYPKIKRLGNRPILCIIGIIITSVIGCLKVTRLTIVPSILLLVLIYAVVPNVKTRATEILSKDSFGIYLFHSPLVYITYTFLTNLGPTKVICINFILFGLVAMILAEIFRRSWLRIFVGERCL